MLPPLIDKSSQGSIEYARAQISIALSMIKETTDVDKILLYIVLVKDPWITNEENKIPLTYQLTLGKLFNIHVLVSLCLN